MQDGWLCVLDDRELIFNGCLVVPKILDLRKNILVEAPRSRYSIHLGETKKYRDLKQQF